MSAAERRRRQRARAQAPPGEASPALLPPLAEWKWRTFPVFFALSGGLLLGCWIGVVVGAAGSDLALYLPVAFALPFGFAFSRFVTRFMITRRWVKPRGKPR